MESIRKSDIEILLIELCGTALAPAQLRVVDCDCRLGPRSIVRLYIEPDREGGPVTSLDDCAAASRLISPSLETWEQIPGPFELEVSSPGLDRRLRLRSDFEQCIGSRIRLKLEETIAGFGSKPLGRLKLVDSAGVELDVDGRTLRVGWGQVRQANKVWESGN